MDRIELDSKIIEELRGIEKEVAIDGSRTFERDIVQKESVLYELGPGSIVYLSMSEFGNLELVLLANPENIFADFFTGKCATRESNGDQETRHRVAIDSAYTKSMPKRQGKMPIFHYGFAREWLGTNEKAECPISMYFDPESRAIVVKGFNMSKYNGTRVHSFSADALTRPYLPLVIPTCEIVALNFFPPRGMHSTNSAHLKYFQELTEKAGIGNYVRTKLKNIPDFLNTV